MKKLILVAVGATLVVGLAASLQPAQANCSAARIVSTKNAVSGWVDIFTPGFPHGTAYGGTATNEVRGAFWSLNFGNPTGVLPPNNDSGPSTGGTGFADGGGGSSSWIELGYYAGLGYGNYIGDYYGRNHWAFSVDGCIDWDGTNGDHVGAGAPDDGQCNVVLLDDDDGAGTGYFLLAAQRQTQADYFVNEALGASGNPSPGGPKVDVSLAALPKPQITGSSSVSATTKNLTVTVPCPIGPANGVYLNCAPAQNTDISSNLRYRLYSVNTAVNAPPTGPGSRDLPGGANAPFAGSPNAAASNPSGWLPLAGGGPAACGAPVNVTVSCVGDQSIWLCASLIADPASNGGFETTNCSGNAVRVDCGPNLANPDEPVIKRDKPTIDGRGSDRDRRSGGR